MASDLFWIPSLTPGRLAMAPRPRGGDWLIDDIASWRAGGIDVVVSLLEDSEAVQLDLQDEPQTVKAAGIEFRSFPIRDRGVPESFPSSIELLWSVKDRLDRGKKVLIHCRQGVGRAGMIAAGVLILFGAASEDAVRAVSAERGVAIPETPQQMDWLRNLSSLRLAAPIPAQPGE